MVHRSCLAVATFSVFAKMTLRKGAQSTATGTDFFCAPEAILNDEKKRFAAKRRRAGQDHEAEWSDMFAEGLQSRWSDYTQAYLKDLHTTGKTIPNSGGPIWDLSQNLYMGSLRKSNCLMPALLPNSKMYSPVRERLLLPQEAALVQGVTMPSMAAALGSPPYTALFDAKCFAPKPSNITFFAGQAFHTHIAGAFLLFAMATVVPRGVASPAPELPLLAAAAAASWTPEGVSASGSSCDSADAAAADDKGMSSDLGDSGGEGDQKEGV